jgi:two-component system cell cycle response regulator DivK
MPADILIVEDYEDNRELLRLMLSAEGHSIREARNGREAVAMTKENPPDLLLMDLSMPVLDGWGALKELRADERTRRIPCVAITAFDQPARSVDGDGDHFDGYLSKPFKSKEVLNLVERLLNDRG